MPTSSDDGRVWGRPEAIDSIGRVPGRNLRVGVTAVGVLAIGFGIYLGTQVAVGVTPTQPNIIAAAEPAVVTACTAIGITLQQGKFPPGPNVLVEGRVITIYREVPNANRKLLVPYTVVAGVTPDPKNGSVYVTITVRHGPTDNIINDLKDASDQGTLLADAVDDVDFTHAQQRVKSVQAKCYNG